MYLSVIVIFLCLDFIYCSDQMLESFLNESLNANGFRKFDKPSHKLRNEDRSSRFLTFNNDASNIRVEMVFAIPFLAIPIGGKPDPEINGVSKPHVDVNIKSLLAMGGIMIMLFFVVPKIVHIYFPPSKPLTKPIHRKGIETNGFDTILHRVDDVLHMYNIDFHSCTQKAMCWTLNNASEKVKQGKANGVEKLLDAISSLYPLKFMLKNTWLWNFLENIAQLRELENGTCQKFSEKCSITQNGLHHAAGSLLAAIKSHKND